MKLLVNTLLSVPVKEGKGASEMEEGGATNECVTKQRDGTGSPQPL